VPQRERFAGSTFPEIAEFAEEAEDAAFFARRRQYGPVSARS
jgi:hypothetical protein